MPKEHPPEFEGEVVAVDRCGDRTVPEVAVDFGRSEESVGRWVRRAVVHHDTTGPGGVQPRSSGHFRRAARIRPAVRWAWFAALLVLVVVASAAGVASDSSAFADTSSPGPTESLGEPDLSASPTPEPTTPEPTGEASTDATPSGSATVTTSVPETPSLATPAIPSSGSTADSATASSRPVPPPVTAPARQDSPVSAQSALIALMVIIVALLLLVRASRRRPIPVPTASGVDPMGIRPTGSAETTRFLVMLGEAMIDAGDPVTDVQATLDRVAHRNGIAEAEVVVFATALIVSLPGTGQVSTAVASAGERGLRMDQIDDVFDVVDLVHS